MQTAKTFHLLSQYSKTIPKITQSRMKTPIDRASSPILTSENKLLMKLVI